MTTRRELLKSFVVAPLALTPLGVRSLRAAEHVPLFDMRGQRLFANRLPSPVRAMPLPGTRTRIVAHFDLPGRFVWH